MAFIIFASAAALIHILFFILESVVFDKPLGLKIFRQTSEQATAQKLFAFNQGFYNLFLAIGVFYGLISHEGSIVMFCLFTMVGAGVILVISKKDLWRGALLQLSPPLLAIIFNLI